LPPWWAVRDSLIEQITVCDRAIRQLAKKDAAARRLMTVPGVGPVVALAYIAVIDDPQRFAHSRDVGAYLGITPKRYQSGEVDQAGRISKCGDGFARTCLYGFCQLSRQRTLFRRKWAGYGGRRRGAG
jgi:transposase